MQLPTTLTLLANTLTLTLALSNPPPSTQNATTTSLPLSIQMSSSITSRSQGIYTSTQDSSGPLQASFVQKSLALLISQYPSHALTPHFSTYITKSATSLLPNFENVTSALRFSMDRLGCGNTFLSLSSSSSLSLDGVKGREEEEEFLHAAQVLKGSVDANRRNKEGGLWYYVYPEWSYLDGMFSFGPFWALFTALNDKGNATAWGELGRQFGLLGEKCAFDSGSAADDAGVPEGLLVHGYDDSKTAVWANNSRGQSPHVWGRSLGWYVLGLLDTVSVLDDEGLNTTTDKNTATAVQRLRDGFVDEFQYRMRAIARSADNETGAWWQVMDQPGREGNYIESSASAMFVTALLRGVRKGYLPSASCSQPSIYGRNDTDMDYVAIATTAYTYLKDTFVVDNGNGTLGWNGTVSVCSLNSTASYEYYVGQPILYDSVLGSAAFVQASLEVEKLGTERDE